MTLNQAKILIVDDDRFVRQSLREILEDAGYAVHEAADGKIALDRLSEQLPDVMLLDLELPRFSGLEVLQICAEKHAEVGIVIISGKGTIQTAVKATKLGAFDFLEKPLEAQRTLLTVRNAVANTQLLRQRNRLVREAMERYRMIGTSPAMQKIFHLIDKAASSLAKVLITGENGTGKEMIARAIHLNSSRAAGPFVAVNCASIPESLIESELFGHQKGAFTGAYNIHHGKFEQAHGGTLFLDEIGDMSLMMQAKTLRALEENNIERLGSENPVAVDVRIIAATNKDIEMEIQQGNFREDLFYRLNVLTIHVPPLREHREDIPDLADFFLDYFAKENAAPAKKLTQNALSLLVEYNWPGNIRQLRNVMERLVILSDQKEIHASVVAQVLNNYRETSNRQGEATLRSAREQFEREFILKTLISHNWKIQETATALGIERSHLWKKMKKHGIGKNH